MGPTPTWPAVSSVSLLGPGFRFIQRQGITGVYAGGYPTPPRWPESVSPCHGGRGEGRCKRQLSGRRLMTEGKSDCEAYLALRWVPGWLLGWAQLRSTLSHPHLQGCLWTSTSMTCICQRSSSRPSSGSFLSPCLPLTSTPTLWASSVSALSALHSSVLLLDLDWTWSRRVWPVL